MCKKSILAAFAVLSLAATASAALAETLTVGITHSEYLPPAHTLHAKVAVPSHYRSDSLKSETATLSPTNALKAAGEETTLRSQAAVNQTEPPHSAPLVAARPVAAPASPPTLERPVIEWFPIPPFMAGVWHKQGDITTSVTDLRTGVSQPLNQWINDEMTVTWGHQSDRQGNIWHANLLPAERDGNETDGKGVKFLTVGQKFENSNAGLLMTRTHYLVSESYGGTVADVFQQEALNHYTPQGNQLQNSSSNRVFAYSGQPLRDGSVVSRYDKLGNFSPTPRLSGIDLNQSLNDYLHSINRTDLMR